MVIIIDTREQCPLDFNEFGVETRRDCLSFGDYACELKDGTRLPIVFERKEKDLVSTLTGDNLRRFKEEIERARVAKCRLVLICLTDYGKLLAGDPHCLTAGQKRALRYGTPEAKDKVRDTMRSIATSKEGTLLALAYDAKYELPHVFIERDLAARYIYRTFYIMGCRYIKEREGYSCMTEKRKEQWV